jgi:hypothetical protein
MTSYFIDLTCVLLKVVALGSVALGSVSFMFFAQRGMARKIKMTPLTEKVNDTDPNATLLELVTEAMNETQLTQG